MRTPSFLSAVAISALLAPTTVAQIPSQGLSIWLRADRGVVASQGRVDSWTDQSPAGHVFQQTGAVRPEFVVDDTGAPLLRFQGGEQLTANLPLNLQTATIFASFRYRGASDNDYLYSFGSAGSNGSQMTLSRRSGGRAYHYDGRTQNIQGSIPTARFVVSTQLYGATGAGSHELRIDGVAQITSTSATYSANFGIAHIGNWSSGNYRFRGDLEQLVVYDRVLIASEISTVETWLATRTAGARTMEHGAGCPGSAGTPRIRSSNGSLPRLGSVFASETLAVPTGVTAVQLFGLDDTHFLGGAALPFTLATLGLPQCTVYVSGDVLLPLVVQGGRGTGSITIPNDPTLLKVCFHLQSVLMDANANPFGVTTSNALTATIGT